MGKSFVIDVDRCTGCHLCVIACKDEHVGNEHSPWTRAQPDTGHFWIRVASLERGSMPRVKMTYLPLLCQHCENAPCMKACGEDAIKRRHDGLVWIDPGACTGCGLCKEACPYAVIYMNEELGIAQKCTACAHRVDEASLPRCAEICPHDAIIFGEDGALLDETERGGRLEVYHPEYQASPRVRWKGLPRPWIAGAVVDPDSDEVIARATITAVDLFEDGSVTVMSDEFGDFWLKGLQNGRKYKLKVTKEGYVDFLAVVTTDGDQDLGMVCLNRARPVG
jgi:Fe-S-cluster-containing dehydrogenase component